MPEPTVVLQAENIFGMDALFNTQTSSESKGTDNVPTNDESGNVACQRNVNEQTNLSQSCTICSAGTPGQIISLLGTFITEFGNFQTAGVVESFSIGMSAGQYATFDITGHQHTVNPHAAGLTLGYADVSDFLPHDTAEAFEEWDGFGVPDFGIAFGTTGTPINATVTFSMNHVDKPDQNGDHFVGKNITPRCELTMTYEGDGSALDAGAIQSDLRANTEGMYDVIVDSFDDSKSNSDTPSYSFTAHANTILATA